ncbi:MAG: aldo/keto reductase [Thermoleophilia bacterium]|nr:aldo/keto reductase [Thermoleophilia bacterium]
MNPTSRVRLGTTSLEVTLLGLGTAPLGDLYEAVGDDVAEATVTTAVELGLGLVDTAPLYGSGSAERRVGRALASVDSSSVTVATKVGRLLRHVDGVGMSPAFDFSYDGVMRSVEESLERLGLDRVDILHIHDPDDHHDEALAGAYAALDQLRSEGSIGAVGAGMNQAEMLARFAREGNFDCFLLAGRYTLLDQGGLAELLPLCVARNIAIIAGGVYNSGLLADPRPGARFDYEPASAALVARAVQLREVCDRHDVPLKAAAIQFPLGHPAVATVVIGARSPAELIENVSMFRHPIPGELWGELRAEGLLPEEVPTPR